MPGILVTIIARLINEAIKNSKLPEEQKKQVEKSLVAFGVKSTSQNGSIDSSFSSETQTPEVTVPTTNFLNSFNKFSFVKLEKRTKYLQIALNSTITDALSIINQLPASERIIIEAGTPLIKKYGLPVIGQLRGYLKRPAYIVADIKTADMGEKEVQLAAIATANAVTCVGVAPIPTIDNFIVACEKYKLDAMIDMMNVENPGSVLKKLKKLPKVVILHRGVDETEIEKEKMLPYYQINQIKGGFDTLVAVAGADSSRDVQSAVFNNVDIVVLWKDFYKADGKIGKVAEEFLEEVR